MKQFLLFLTCIVAFYLGWLGEQYLDNYKDREQKLGSTVVIKAFEWPKNPIRLKKGDLLIIEQDSLEFYWPIRDDLIITGAINITW